MKTDRSSMRYWLARTLREIREAQGLSQQDVAQTAGGGIDHATISRLENNLTWPGNLDEIIVAYATIAKIEDPRDLWLQVIARYRKEGTIPVGGDLSPRQRAVLDALEARQRRRRGPA